jgi:hypothetical protein
VRYNTELHEFIEFIDEPEISAAPFSVVAIVPALVVPLTEVTFEFDAGEA